MMAILIGGKVKHQNRSHTHSKREQADAAWQDPGSITIVWALYELARNPNIVKSLREEIASK